MEEVIITPLEARQQEVAAYQLNIAMYQSMAATLPSEWPAHLLQYKNSTERHGVIGTIEDLDDVNLLSDLWAHDDCHRAIRTETLEMRKSLAILQFLQSQV